MKNVIWGSPLEKYLELFSNYEKPSQKIKRAEASSCDNILKQIKEVKTTKHIECADENTKYLCNLEKPPERKNVKQKNEKQIKKINERKLKKQILRDIKEEYQNQ